MPNWVYNNVTMHNIANENLFVIENGKKHFDFNKLIEMPETMHIVSGSVSNECAIIVLFEKTEGDPAKISKNQIDAIGLFSMPSSKEEFQKKYAEAISDFKNVPIKKEHFDRSVFYKDPEHNGQYRPNTLHEAREFGELILDNIEKFGAPDWYYWSNKNWGSKWNACDTDIISDNEISFDTAWCSPLPIMIKLSERFPDRPITVEACYEDGGEETYQFINGMCVG